MSMKNHFHIKGRAPTLVLKQRPRGTRRWPITSLLETEADLHIARHFNIAEIKPHAHRKTHSHTMKVYNTRPSQFC